MTGTRFLACFAALALSTSACGVLKSPDSKSDGPRGGAIGDEFTEEPTSAPTTAKPTTTVRRPATRATTDPDACRPGDNTSEVRYDPGLVLELKVSTTCAVKATNITFNLKITNTSPREIRWDPNQIEYFSIKPPRGENKPSWRDRDCTPLPTDRRQLAKTMTPGQTIEFTNKYPGPDSVADREKCRKLESGAYDAHAVFVLCEGPAFNDGYCEASKADQLFAQPIRINFARP
ncbi:MAG TPA: hypothetical protein VNB24_04195 [Acidimicrobiales bacterium]|nr:hypothetical protein [Acidimicrobiales bacterium]